MRAKPGLTATVVLLALAIILLSIASIILSSAPEQNYTAQPQPTPPAVQSPTIVPTKTQPTPFIPPTPPIIPPPNPPSPGQYNFTEPPNYSSSQMESDIYDLVNLERTSVGLRPLDWNPQIATVARMHSAELAIENQPLTARDLFCPRPFIHHEGFTFGLYWSDRLYNQSIFDFSSSGENIFMTSTWHYLETYDKINQTVCPDNGTEIPAEFSGPDAPNQVKAALAERLAYVATAQRVNWSYAEWLTQDQLENTIVQGWMESPGHRANILDDNYTETGIGVVKVNDYLIVTQDFTQKVDCGFINASCCPINASAGFCYNPWRCQGSLCG